MFQEIKKTLRQNWDGTERLSSYAEYDNIVQEVIENNGRILHEETTGGYTHEVINRGEFQSDDYYFPNWGSSSRRHNHYEIHSDGNLLVNGKLVCSPDGRRMSLADIRELTGENKFDRKASMEKICSRFEDLRCLEKYGQCFQEDIEKISQQIDQIRNSGYSDEEAKPLILALNDSINRLKLQYLEVITKAEEEIEEEQMMLADNMGEAAQNAERIETSLRSVQLSASDYGTETAAKKAAEEAERFKKLRDETTQKVEAVKKQFQAQRERIMRSVKGR